MPGRPWTLLPTPGAERHQGVFAPFLRLYGSRRRAGTDVFFMQKEEENMKKRALSLLMAFILVIGLLPATARAAEGTADDLIEISSEAELKDFRNKVNAGEKNLCAKLTKDITLSEDWTPISSNAQYPSEAFSGTFDGNGHTIKGLRINASTAYQGFFAYTNGATIKNLTIDGSVTSSENYVGGIVGNAPNTTIQNCLFSGSVTTTKNKGAYVGGIAGYAGGSSTAAKTTITGCVNKATVTGEATDNAGGIAGYAQFGTISYCYNTGKVSGKTGYAAGIVGSLYKKSAISYSYDIGNSLTNVYGFKYWNATVTSSYVGNGASNLLNEGDGNISFVADENNINNGYPILSWQKTSGGGEPEPPTPGISISGNQTLWTVAGGKNVTQATLTVSYADMGDEKPAVTWGYPAESDAAAFAEADGALVVDALGKTGGTEKVTASVQYNENTYEAECTITVIPYITYVDIVNLENGVIAPGQTVEAQVSVGGKPYLASYPELKYQWWRYDTSTLSAEKITNATEKSYTIPEDYTYNRIQVEVTCNGVTVSAHDQHKTADVLSGDDALLALDKAALTLEKLGVSSTTITAETTLKLPDKGANGSKITWESRDPSVIDPTTGKVTLPAEGEQKVTLTAKLTLNDSTGKLPREFTIKSKAAQAVDADKETLEKAAKALSVLYPTFGKDSNVQTMVETRLAKEFPDVGVMYTGKTLMNATATEAHSDISDNGNVTYFYTDLTTTDLTTTLQRFDTYEASFTLTCGKETKTVEIPVTVCWDADKVRGFMTKEVLDQTTLPEQTTEALMLPTSGKWTTISWTSSDPTIIANDGTITRSTIDQQAVLTATFTFNFTSDVTGNEQLIVLYKVFEVTVKGNADAADRAALYQQKLKDALAAPGLKDFVTGEKLTEENGVYTTINDIQFPTTRDLKIDGKYTPVVITSSDPGVIEAPTTPNSARVWVYRPLPGESAKTVTLTMKILDRPNGPQPGDDLSTMRVLASKEIKVTVQPLTQAEIDAEIALMAKVKAAYWDGIRNANTDQNNVTTDLHAFQECYLDTDGSLTWVYDREDLKNHGIVPVPLDNWYDLQIWRLFRSSNAEVITHENLLVTRQGDSKAVTITSYLSSETLGKYAEKYPQNADFQKLYKQPVTIDLVVTGTQYAQGGDSTVRKEAARYALSNRAMLTVDFTLTGRGMGFTEDALSYAEGSTVYDVFSDLLVKHGYTCKRRGSYIAAITSNSGVTLEEFDEGKNSGWMYRVNGKLVGRYMSAQGLKDGDRIELYFTSDWTSEPGAEGWQKPGKIETIVNADGSVTKIETKSDGTVIETTTWRDGSTLTAETSPNGRVETVEKRADGTTVETVESASGGITASVSVPKSVGSTRVDIPVSKPTGSMVAVIVHPDGTEEIVKGSVVTETGVALRAEGDVRLKIIDNAKRFNDMADHWAKDAVEFASSRELFNGVGNDAFGPDLSMTRGMVSTVLARLAGADTAGGETWYAKGTVWAVENGISDGTAPEQPVTREQLAAMLYRYAGSPAVSGELGFDDADSISAWARDAVRWCVDNGILNGVGGNRMTPQDLARRGQVAAMLMRFLQATV